MEGPSPVETHESLEKTADLLAVLEKVNNPSRDEQRQKTVLDNLPSDFLTELKAHLHLQYIHRDGYEKTYWGKEIQELSEVERGEFEHQILRGALFEMLVQHDEQLIEKPSKTADELLTLLQDPSRYNLLNEIGKLRNPDLAYVDINDKGRIIIKGVGEAKLGKLNHRSLHQLENFEGSVGAVKKAVNNLKHSKKMKRFGLDGLAGRKVQMEEIKERGSFVDVSDDFEKVLIVPSDRKIEGEGVFEHLFGKGAQSEHNKRKFQALQREIKIKKAAFSIKEVAEIANHVYEQIESGL